MNNENLKLPLKLKEIAKLVNGEISGDDEVIIKNVEGITEAGEGDISFLSNNKYIENLASTKASAIIVSKDIESIKDKNLLKVENPYFAFTQILSIISKALQSDIPREIHKNCVIGEGVKLGKGVSIGAYTVIEKDVEIGEGTTIYPGCYIGQRSKIGSNGLIYANVSIREDSIIGKNFIVHSGTVIGSDGFGFVNFKGINHKIPQIGKVIIEDDVEIGANTTIDRATFGITHIGKGTKIDNLVQIAHNVKIGENCFIISQVGIAGSTKIGNDVTMAGKSGVAGHINIGNKVVVAAQAGVTHDVPDQTVVSGFPARPHNKVKRIYALTQKLPEMYKDLQDIKKKIEQK